MDLSQYSIEHFTTDQVDLARFSRMAHRIYPVLPDWLHQDTSIYALYFILAGILVVTLICYYTTLETVVFQRSRASFSSLGKAGLLFWDLVFTYLSYQILTA
ncbi:MAG: hypothetical protein JWM80_995 [Cyanobacteria bacterium RYN_339]|nr:hypothetical protein [Cyanobacteria bacterium RYN_339]